jgi:hypothetical protein
VHCKGCRGWVMNPGAPGMTTGTGECPGIQAPSGSEGEGLDELLDAAATMLNQEAAGNCPDHPVSIADLLNMAMRLTKEARRLTERAKS